MILSESATLPAARTWTPLPWQPEELATLEPRVRLNVVQWAQKYRRLSPKTSAIPGAWEWEKVVFLVEPAAAFDDYDTHQVTVQGPTQFGKTELANNIVGQTVDQDPAPLIVCMPTEDDAKIRVSTRVRPMFETSPRLLDKLGGDVSRLNVGEPTDFGDMLLYLAWAGSSATMADRPVAKAICDEVGEYRELPGETDAINKIRNRMGTFSFWKLLVTSSPKLQSNLISREFDAGDKREYWMRCPRCSQFHVPVWENVKFDKGADGHMLEPDAYRDPKTSRYVCPKCNFTLADDRQRWEGICEGLWAPAGCRVEAEKPRTKEEKAPARNSMRLLDHILAGGRWDDVGARDADAWIVGPGAGKKPPHRSYHVSGLMLNTQLSKTGRLTDLVREFAVARLAQKAGNLSPLQNWINNRMGKSWEEVETRTSETQLAGRVDRYDEGVVPELVDRLTIAFDVQMDHVYCQVWGWGHLYEAWLIYAGRVETGDTGKIDNWGAVAEMLGRTWPLRENPKESLRWSWGAIDCRYHPEVVYPFCRGCGFPNLLPMTGEDAVPPKDMHRFKRVSRGQAHSTKPKRYSGLRRCEFNPSSYKDRLAYMTTNDRPGSGYIHLYARVPDSFIRQWCSEEKTLPRTKRGRTAQIWALKRGHYHNHHWDCGVMSLVLADIAGVARIPNPDSPPPARGGRWRVKDTRQR